MSPGSPYLQSAFPPPTIGDLKAQGVKGVIAICDECPRPSTTKSWDAIGLPDETEFPSIVHRRQFRCETCGAAGRIMPDWAGMYDLYDERKGSGNWR